MARIHRFQYRHNGAGQGIDLLTNFLGRNLIVTGGRLKHRRFDVSLDVAHFGDGARGFNSFDVAGTLGVQLSSQGQSGFLININESLGFHFAGFSIGVRLGTVTILLGGASVHRVIAHALDTLSAL